MWKIGTITTIKHRKVDASIIEMVLFFCALFSTMSIVAICVSRYIIQAFRIFFFVFMVLGIIHMIKSSKIVFKHKASWYLLIWMLLSVVSCFFGMFYYLGRPQWSESAVSSTIKAIVFLLFVLVFFANHLNPKYIMEGLLCGSIFNILWAGIDYVYYHYKHRSLTNIVFKRYINATGIGGISIFERDVIRPAGFNADPASIGLFASFVFGYGIYHKKSVCIILGIAGCLFSGSTTGMVCCILVFLSALCFRTIKVENVLRMTWKKLLVVCLGLIIFALCVIKVFPIVMDRISQIITRISVSYVHLQGENIRVTYVKEFPTAIVNQGFKIITGTGFNSAIDGYLKGNLKSNTILNSLTGHAPYDMENTYIAYFFDCGIVGFTFYILLLGTMLVGIRRIMKCNNREKIICIAYAALLATVTTNIFYHYTLYSFHILLFVGICRILEEESVKY